MLCLEDAHRLRTCVMLLDSDRRILANSSLGLRVNPKTIQILPQVLYKGCALPQALSLQLL